MTAEVAIMNKWAVALAADSAVTIAPARKVFNSAEKLFTLLPGHSIGLLIYNHPEFMQLPWEAIVKKYRDSFVETRLNTLQDYADDFISFLSRPDNGLISEEQCNITFGMTVNHYLNKIRNEIIETVQKKVDDRAKRISLKEILDITSHWIDTYYKKWQKFDNQYSEDDTNNIKRDLEKYRPVLEQVRSMVFRQLPLSESNKHKLEEFCFSLFYKSEITAFQSGVVIAGFGEKDLYPSCIEYIIENCFFNHLKYRELQRASIAPNNRGIIMPFAQRDIVANLLGGIHPDLLNSLNDELETVFCDESINEIIKKLKGLRSKRKTEIIKSLEKLKKDKQEQVVNNIRAKFKKEHTDSILNTVAFLPKDELANMAESLVSITSFMRRVSMEVESVGGPIDVVVISKKDGFVWIKRKHYFDSKYNPQFNLRYLSEAHHETEHKEKTGSFIYFYPI